MGRVLTARTQRRSSPDAWQGPDTYSAKFQQRRNKVNIVKDKMSQGPEEGVINSHCGEAVLSQPGRMTRILTAGEASPAEEQPELTAGRTTHPRAPRQGLRAPSQALFVVRHDRTDWLRKREPHARVIAPAGP